MKKNILILAVIICVMGLIGCESCKQGPPVMPSEENDVQKDGGETSHSVKVWPYLEDGKDINLSKDLIAKNYVLVFDGSSSMDARECSGDKTKCEAAKDAVIEWAKSVSEKANIGLVSFNAEGWTKVLLGSKSRSEFIEIIEEIRADNSTPLATAIKEAYEMLTEQAQKQLGYGEYSIVVITDGADNDPAVSLIKWTEHILTNTPIIIYTIGFCIDESHSLNQPGRTVYRTADNPEALRQGLRETLAEAESFDASFNVR